MTTYKISDSQQKAAKWVGIAYLFTFIVVVYANFGIYNKLNVLNNASETVRRILANEHLFRIGIIMDIVYAIGFIVLLSSLYTILKDISKRAVILAVFWQLVYVITWVALTLKFFDALRLMHGADYLKGLSDDNLFSLSKIFLSARFDRYYGGLIFYTLGATVFNFLWFKSKFIPRPLALWGIIACIWCTLCTIAYLIYPELDVIINVWTMYDVPMALFDITLAIWLLIKGLKQ